jgi:glycosyltransferase involved in cell wall biosynthesis
VADYAGALLPALSRYGMVEEAPRTCDVALYHLGNNRLHAHMYERALEQPGVLVLHDAVLHHFLLGRLKEPLYIEEFVYNYGEWGRDLARELWRRRGTSASESRYFEFPMLRRVCERSRAVIVHNPAAACAVREHAPGTRVIEIPHLYQAPAQLQGGDAQRWRAAHHIPPEAFLFGVFGYLRESKRLFSVMQAFARLHRERTATGLLIAGAFVSSDFARAAAPLLDMPGTFRVGHLPEREFELAAAAVDACINLRSPGAGETSGIAIRLMGRGKPVLLTDSLENTVFPEGSCLRVASGASEAESLYWNMVLLTSMTDVAREVGGNAAEHIRRRHSIGEIAGRYWNTLCTFGV